MKKLDSFILKSFLGPFVMTFLIVIFVLVMQFLWLYIDELVGKGLSFGVILEFLGWGSATLIPMALPLATLLASIMTMGNMGENNELLAMKAAGISLQRIISPLILVSVIISIGAFFASNDLIPVAYNKIYTLRDDIGKTKEEIKIPTGIFYNGVDGYSIRISERDKNNIMHNIMVYNHSGNKGNVSLTIADSGHVRLSNDKSSMIFTLFSGINYEETNKKEYRDTSLSLQKIDFSSQEVIIPLENYAFQKSDDARYGNEVMAKDLKQLAIDRDSLKKVFDKTLDSQLSKSISSSNLIYTFQFDTSKASRYKGIIDIDTIFASGDLHDRENAINRATNVINNQISSYRFYERELFQSAHPLRRATIESYRKFTLSLACLIFFFIGAPLGAIIRKGGLGTPVIVSMLFFVIYWVVDISGKKLANDGAIGPFAGTFISTFVLIPIGIFLTIKSTRDSALFNADAYKIFFHKISNRFSKLRKKAHNQ
ncbi:MAG: LptF/LptG family permease [Bacteroidales bacterium]|nr:LptF/LptG family permease [Bacteroidales bacterium]